MPAPKKEKASQTKKAPSFEEALEELEAMVETMESGQLPLEKLVTNYERGAALIAHCESVLGDARKRLELITLKPKPTPQEEEGNSNNSTQEDSPESPHDSNDNNDDEIRLF